MDDVNQYTKHVYLSRGNPNVTIEQLESFYDCVFAEHNSVYLQVFVTNDNILY